MSPSHIEHIGIAVGSLAESIPFYERLLGSRCSSVEEVPDQRVKIAFFIVGQTKIELMESTSPDGPVGKFIQERGEGLHHIAFAVEDLPGALGELKKGGTRLIDKQPRRGAEGKQVAFLHPRSTGGVLIELCSARR